MSNPVVLVTGGSSGIGKAVVEHYAATGASVVLAARSAVSAAAGTTNPENIYPIPVDVSDLDSIAALYADIRNRFGRLDIAVNCAGVEMAPAPLHETEARVIEQMLDVNLRSVIYCMQEEVKLMLEFGSGNIVNIASVAALKGFPGGAVYSAAKSGVCMLTRSAAHDYARAGIRINCVAPGVIATPMSDRMSSRFGAEAAQQMIDSMPMGRMGTSQEVSDVITWLCSDQASFVNGAIITADGGILA